jgi:hypothetical protein
MKPEETKQINAIKEQVAKENGYEGWKYIYADMKYHKAHELWLEVCHRYKQAGSAGITNIHPEDFCEKCKGRNPVWYAENELWNKVTEKKVGIICPPCFDDMAIEKGENIIFKAIRIRDDVSAGITKEQAERLLTDFYQFWLAIPTRTHYMAGVKKYLESLPATPPSIVADSAGERDGKYTETDLRFAMDAMAREINKQLSSNATGFQSGRFIDEYISKHPPTSKAESVSEGDVKKLGISDAAELMYSGGKNLSYKEAGALEKSFEKSIKIRPVSEGENKSKPPCPNCKETIAQCACMRNICIDCGKSVGNITFSVCDDCCDRRDKKPASKIQPVSDEGKDIRKEDNHE